MLNMAKKSMFSRVSGCISEGPGPIPRKNIKSLNSIGLLFKKPELFKIGARSSELELAEEHRCVGGSPSSPPFLSCHLDEMTHVF